MEIKEAIGKIVDGKNLNRPESSAVMEIIMKGEATPSQIAAFITALRIKGETIDEITGSAEVMRRHAIRITPYAGNLVDTCGTGGDVSHTFNISTISAVVASAAGVAIAKHGNRSVSSKCGSADLLEALGIKIDQEPEKVQGSIDKSGFGFIFAPKFHPAMKFAMPSRREIGIRTVFNILGPLTNPAGASHQLLGVYSADLTKTMAQVLKNLGSKRVMVVHGMDGLDEISISDRTKVSELKGGRIRNYFIKPEDFGLRRGKKKDLVCMDIESSKKTALAILKGEEKGSRRNIILLNAGAVIYVGDKAKDINDGIKMAREAIESGKAAEKLEQIRNA